LVDAAAVRADLASSSAKLFVAFAAAGALAYETPPVVAAETAGVGSIIGRVVGAGGRFLSGCRRIGALTRARARRFCADLPMTVPMRRSSAFLPLLAAVVWLALLAVPAIAAAPAATAVPTITGNARAGQTLTSTTGTFAGSAPLTYGRAWQRCDSGGAACVPIAGASATTYTPVTADVGTTIRVTVTATNVEGSASSASPATAVIAPLSPPVNDLTGLPVISGTVRDGQVLSATDGTWTGTTPITFTRLWRRCDAGGAACTSLAGAATHTLTSADVGSTIRVEVTGHNPDGLGVATSAQTAVVDSAAPLNSVLPTVTGQARSGQTLTSATTGTWTGTVPMTYARQWMRCDIGGGACTPITGAIGSTYLVDDADIGSTIRVAVTATNVKSSVAASSAASATVGPKLPPVSTADPTVTGSPVDAQLLTAADGTWTGTAPITTTRRWQRCDVLGATCVDLAGTGTTMTLTSADVGSTIRTRVTATNADGTTQAVAAVTPVIGPAIPSSTAAPSVSGSAREGQLLTVSQGTWKGTPAISYAFEWQRCSSGTCSTISGETASTYRAVAADVTATLRAAVTATNAGGATVATSAQTVTVAGGVPVDLGLPGISSPLPRDGELYTATLGSWVGTAPLLYDRQWLRCNAAGNACAPISGEIADTYRVAGADVGKTLRIEITATNAFGTTKAQSAQSPVILAAPPQAAPPTIGGLLRDGQTLTAASSWSGTAPIALTYQWQRCDAMVATCVDIAAATSVTYRLASADVGSRMRVKMGALNAGGGGSAMSDLAFAGDPAGLVAPDAPHATTAPVLTGTAIEGGTLTTGDGIFSGTSPLTRTIQWQRCDAAGSNCADIAGATVSDRVLTAADRGSTLRSVVTAANPTGSDSIASAVSAVVAMAPPHNVVAPSVSPDTGLRDGATLVSTDGGWTGSQPQVLTYRWDRCTTPTACVPVPGAAGPTYMLTTTDVGFALRIAVTATNGAGSSTQTSTLTGVVGTNPPVSVTPPTVAGTPQDGEVLTAIDGTWVGPVVFTTTYEWWRCDTLGANCTIIAGATAPSLVLSPADIGLSIRARVFRTGAGGSTGVYSDPTLAVVAAAPQNAAPPQITGGAAVGKTLTADPGVWTGSPLLSFSYQWQSCAPDGSGCADIPGAVAATYLETAADDDTSLRVVVTASNAVGSASATSASTLEVQTDPPSMLASPAIVAPAGPVAVGVTLTAQPGTWGGAVPIAFAYQWARCDAALLGCAPITGATASTYLLVKADIGKRIVVTVTATNVVDTTTALSDGTTTVLPEAPSNVGLPAVTAATGARDGAKLVASTGTWNGATPMTFTINWLRCEADGTGCGAIPGAIGTNYTLTAEDVGHRVRVRVDGTNTTAEIPATSAATAVVLATPPVSTGNPTVVAVEGKPIVGSRVRAQTGNWGGTGPVAFDIRWQRCPTSSLACDDVPGATDAEYTLADADIGKRLRVVVTARNAAASAVANSAPTVVVPPVAPDSTVPPTVTGSAREGGELSAGTGTWSGTQPMSFIYQWERCTNPSDVKCTSISGATRTSYTATKADVGSYLRVSVSASNGGGKATRVSAVTDKVVGTTATTTVTTTKKKTTSTKSTTKKTTTKKKTTTVKKPAAKKKAVKRSTVKKKTAKKKVTIKRKATKKKTVERKATKKKIVKRTTTKTSTTKKSTTKKRPTTKKTVTKKKNKKTKTKKAADKKTTTNTTTTGTEPTTKDTNSRTHPIAQLQRVQITPTGRVVVTMSCPKSRTRACGASGTVVAGTSLGKVIPDTTLTFTIADATVAPRKTITRSFDLTTAQLDELRALADVNFQVRLAAPAAPKRVNEVFVHATVPAELLAQAPSG
jgi:hypothetical protein